MAPGVAEYNRTNTAMEELLGVHETAQYSGEGTYFNTTVFWVRQDLPYVAMLDTVDLKPTTREHFLDLAGELRFSRFHFVKCSQISMFILFINLSNQNIHLSI